MKKERQANESQESYCAGCAVDACNVVLKDGEDCDDRVGRRIRISAAALELGDLVTVWYELLHEESSADWLVGVSAAHITDRKLTAAERREAKERQGYFDGQAYGFMKSRQHVEGLMEVLGLTDTWQLRCRDLNVHNANAKA